MNTSVSTTIKPIEPVGPAAVHALVQLQDCVRRMATLAKAQRFHTDGRGEREDAGDALLMSEMLAELQDRAIADAGAIVSTLLARATPDARA
jgi:hypothetical protein